MLVDSVNIKFGNHGIIARSLELFTYIYLDISCFWQLISQVNILRCIIVWVKAIFAHVIPLPVTWVAWVGGTCVCANEDLLTCLLFIVVDPTCNLDASQCMLTSQVNDEPMRILIVSVLPLGMPESFGAAIKHTDDTTIAGAFAYSFLGIVTDGGCAATVVIAWYTPFTTV